MCGLLGEISPNLTSSQNFRKLLNQSRHRGPDQQEVWSDHVFCQFGFNRLSILDLSENGKQPLVSPSGRYVLVFNGEIYNYKALQQQYHISDRELRSSSDSEIIAQLLDKISIEALAKSLNGMFAIAVYDQAAKQLHLFRDFAGIKPLFYGVSETAVVFASQFDQVFLHPAFSNALTIDAEGLYEYVALGYMAAPKTVFKNILQCQPGELVEIDASFNISKKVFLQWQPNTGGTLQEKSTCTYKSFDFLMDRVVKDQLVADVPVGVFLSGGIDSPLVAAYAKKHKANITAYTIGSKDVNSDESAYAKMYAKSLHLNHKVVFLGQKEIVKYNDQHFETLTEPFGDASSLPTFLITHIAKNENTVMLSGDGGDELFWGYPRFLTTTDHLYWFRYPLAARKLGAGILRRAGYTVSYAVSHLTNIQDWILGQQSYNNAAYLDNLLPDLTYSADTVNFYTSKNKLESKEQLLQWLRWNEFYGHLQRVLTKVDRASMGNSLEVRVPFLDKRIIDFAWQLKPSLGITHREPKYLLKQVLRNKLAPLPINVEKLGFGIPMRRWLRQELKEDVKEHLLSMPIFGGDLWNEKAVHQRVNNFLYKDEGNEYGIWVLYALQKWANRYHFV